MTPTRRVVDRLLASPALRRALGPALDGRLAVQRLGRLRRRGPREPAAHLALARLDRRIAQRGQGLRPDGRRDARRRRGRARRPAGAPRHRLPGAELVQVQPQRLARQHRRAHLQGVPRPHDQLRPLPRPQVRPDRARRLLPLPRLLRAARVRTDRVPGQPDYAKDGLPRVYDAKPKTPTFLFRRGNEKEPDKDTPLKPGVPAVLGARLAAIAPVSLAEGSHLPGLCAVRPRGDPAREAAAEVDAKPSGARQAKKAAKPGGRDLAEKALVAAQAASDGARGAGRGRRREATPARPGQTPSCSPASPPWPSARPPTSRPKRTGRGRGSRTLRAAKEALKPKPRRREGKKAVADAEAATAAEALKGARDRADCAWPRPTRPTRRSSPIYPATSTGRRLALARWIVDAREPADGPGGGQSRLDAALRLAAGPDRLRLRPQRQAADASGAARLAGRRVHGSRLEPEGAAPADRDEPARTGCVSTAEDASDREPRGRPGQPLPLADEPAPAWRPRPCATTCWRSPGTSTRRWAARPRPRSSGETSVAQPLLPPRQGKADDVPAACSTRPNVAVLLPAQRERRAAAGPRAGQQQLAPGAGPRWRPQA